MFFYDLYEINRKVFFLRRQLSRGIALDLGKCICAFFGSVSQIRVA
jgi:hypothetical protein